MKLHLLPKVFFALFGTALIGTVVWPHLDMIVSGWFYNSSYGFFWSELPVFVYLHEFAVKGAWALGSLFVIFVLIAYFGSGRCGGLTTKGWVFLLLALLIGPVLIANVGFKDHWGRVRPRETYGLGGYANFSPALLPQPYATQNGSFVSGDGSFGFFLPSFAYLVPLGSRRQQSRRVFWGCMAAGGCIAFSRLAMGAHFLSDNLFAGLFVLASSAALHAAMYGWRSTRDYWRAWLN